VTEARASLLHVLARLGETGQADPALIREAISMLGGGTPAVPAVPMVPAPRAPERLLEPLSQAEARVLRFLQTSLSAPEIASELYMSVNTVRTHMRHLYDKLGAHRRLEAVDRARTLGLLAPVPHRA
jgi:LuxR family transcriptional regulator, maltose regulon positive regulatory protein